MLASLPGQYLAAEVPNQPGELPNLMQHSIGIVVSGHPVCLRQPRTVGFSVESVLTPLSLSFSVDIIWERKIPSLTDVTMPAEFCTILR